MNPSACLPSLFRLYASREINLYDFLMLIHTLAVYVGLFGVLDSVCCTDSDDSEVLASAFSFSFLFQSCFAGFRFDIRFNSVFEKLSIVNFV